MPPDDTQQFLEQLKRDGAEKVRRNLAMGRYGSRKLELARDFIAEEERCLARTQHREQMTTGRIAATAAVIAAVCALATLIATLLR